MYSYFMIIGKLELIEADIIGVNTGKECLEVNIKTSKYPELKVNDMIAVKGTIKAKGLCADKVYVTNPYIQEMKESDQAEEESTQEEVETVEEPKTIEEYAYDGQKWDLEKLLMLPVECETYTIPMDKIDDIYCVAYLLELNDKYYVLETTVAGDDSHDQFFNAPYETDKTRITDVEYKYLPRPNKPSTDNEVEDDRDGCDTQVKYPKDFQPLYKVNEKITIKYDYDRVVEPLHILQIQPVKTDGKITGYNYKVLIEVVNGVNNKSGIKIYSEDFLADNEVIEG